ncbi:trehalose-phosphatase [Blastomonas sp.]|uniref:trehalose-phosphatase n=1 Tax=Blastomonas sp. TaxID=1909299 RepID=UPI0026047DEB|nr:trehalose-phosphatase [Blastomonas sp.]MDM7955833.1 trehalose-phosphatase [Blastomonas sp.]
MHISPAQNTVLDPQTDPAPRTALLLDFDGTLVDITRTPDSVDVSRELVAVITSASERLAGRVAIVSGRSIAQLEALWPGSLPDMVMAGSHGQELKVEGTVDSPVHTDVFARLAAAASGHFADDGGIVIEEKTFGLGVHYRLAPALRETVQAWVAAMADAHDLFVQQGDMVFELRPRGADKGDAVRAIMALDRFEGSRPLYIGDDLTDIPAFQAVQAMGGAAISVGPRTADHSDEQLTDVRAVLTRIGEIGA